MKSTAEFIFIKLQATGLQNANAKINIVFSSEDFHWKFVKFIIFYKFFIVFFTELATEILGLIYIIRFGVFEHPLDIKYPFLVFLVRDLLRNLN